MEVPATGPAHALRCGLALAGSVGVASGLVLLGARGLGGPGLLLLCVGLLGLAPLTVWAVTQRRTHQSDTLCLRRLRARWELLRRDGGDLFWEVSPDGCVTHVGSDAAELLAAQPDQLIGRSVFTLVCPDDVDRARRLFQACVSRRTGWDRFPVRALRVDGDTEDEVSLESSAIVQLSADGDVAGFIGTSRPAKHGRTGLAALESKRSRVRQVLGSGAISVVVQPIFSVETGRVVGVEGLSRFPAEPRQGPDRWFADAHEVGLGIALEVLAVESVLRQSARLEPDLYVSVNVSPATLTSPALQQAVVTGPVAADRIVLELTEHVSVTNYTQLISAIHTLRAGGLRLAIDDAGAGFASFRHILRLQPDLIKIDQAIIRDINTEPGHRALAAALVMFAMEVGSTTIVAEGIETADELQTVASLGIDAAQGYYLGRPGTTLTGWNPITDVITLPPG